MGRSAMANNSLSLFLAHAGRLDGHPLITFEGRGDIRYLVQQKSKAGCLSATRVIPHRRRRIVRADPWPFFGF